MTESVLVAVTLGLMNFFTKGRRPAKSVPEITKKISTCAQRGAFRRFAIKAPRAPTANHILTSETVQASATKNTTINTSATGAAWGTTPASGVGYTTVGGITTDETGNPYVEWEEATKSNVGIELGLFEDLSIQADLFRDYRDGIFLMRQSTPSAIGLQKDQYVNIGEMLNRGFDMSAEYDHTFANGFRFSARANYTFNRN